MHRLFISGIFYLFIQQPFPIRAACSRDPFHVFSANATVTMSSLSRLLLDAVVLEQIHLLEELDSEGELKF
jgi:hypothetical protein